MEKIVTKQMTNEDLSLMKKRLIGSLRMLRKIALYLLGFFSIILFVPLEILKVFAKRGARSNISGILFEKIGLTNTLIFILLPIIGLLVLMFIYGANKIRKDINAKVKEICTINVKEISELSESDKKSRGYSVDYVLKFDKNSFKVSETYFLKSKQSELMEAKAFIIEVSQIAKVELSRKITNNIA